MKNRAKVFFKNSFCGIMIWELFNFLYLPIFFSIDSLPHHWDSDTPFAPLNEAMAGFAFVYIFGLLVVFVLSALYLKDIGNIILNSLSILFFRFFELAILIFLIFTEHTMIVFVNWPIAALERFLLWSYGIGSIDFELSYFTTSLIPFAVMLIGIYVGKFIKKRKKLRTQGDDSSVSNESNN